MSDSDLVISFTRSARSVMEILFVEPTLKISPDVGASSMSPFRA